MDYYYVTGTSRGLGRALAEALLQDPEAAVVGLARGEGIPHPRYRHVALDLSDLDAVSAFRFDAHPDARRVALVNNAASLLITNVGDAQPETIVKNFHINAIAPTILMNAFVAAYRATEADMVICNLTTTAAQDPVEGASLYGGPKAAIEMITRVIERERTPRLKAFCIDPRSMDTGMQTYLRSLDPSEWERAEVLRRRYEDGFVMPPATVAAAISRVLRDPMLAPGAVFVWNEIGEA